MYSPQDGMLVHRRVTCAPSIKFDSTNLYTSGTAREKCLAQEHKTMPLVRARNQTAPSGLKFTKH